MSVDTTPATAPGLLANLLSDAIDMAQRGFASRADIDTAMRLGAGHPQGPFAYLAALSVEDRPVGLAAPGGIAGDTGSDIATATENPYGGAVGVLGTGHMAAGIVECVARAGAAVVVLSRSEASSNRLRAQVAGSLERQVSKGRLHSEDATETLGRVHCTEEAADLAECGLVVEAVAENLAVKHAVLVAVEGSLAPSATLATNTSSYEVAEVAQVLPDERRAMALHFFNPAPAMKLLEIVVPEDAAERNRAVETARSFAHWLGKVPVTCGDERGFIVNRLLIPYLNDAAAETTRGLDVAATDALMREQAKHPMGPLALVDLIGVDVTVAALQSLHEVVGSDRTAPDPALLALLERCDLGRKSGRGFYDYTS